jgi:hypothetical protein
MKNWLLTSILIPFKCQSGRLILYSMWTTMSALWLDTAAMISSCTFCIQNVVFLLL